MRIRFAVFTIIGAAAFLIAYAPVRASQGATTTTGGAKTTWDGIYTDAQATKGEALYNDKCIRCHGTNAAGADAPALAGPDFAADWDGLTIDQLSDRIRTTMPQDDPESLSREESAILVAYLLQKNGFPAGQTELASAADALHAVKYVATKP